jgi:hypothetical protein
MTSVPRTTSLRTSRAVLVLLTWAAVACVGDAQEIAVQNDTSAPVNVTATDITAMPHQKVSVDDHGKTITFEGVPLRLVLERRA